VLFSVFFPSPHPESGLIVLFSVFFSLSLSHGNFEGTLAVTVTFSCVWFMLPIAVLKVQPNKCYGRNIFGYCPFIFKVARPGDNREIFSIFAPISAFYRMSNNSKVEAILYSACSPRIQAKLLACSPRYPFNTECQAEKLWLSSIVRPKDFKSWYSQLSCLTFSIKRDSVKLGRQVGGGGAARGRQVRLLCPWGLG